MGQLTVDYIRLIRVMYEDGYTLHELVELYHDINPDRIRKVVAGSEVKAACADALVD